MKKFTFFVCALMVALTISAQEVTPPEGSTIQYYSRAGGYYDTNWDTGELDVYSQSGSIGVVFDGTDVYIQNLVSTVNDGNWSKGTLSADGKTITIPADNVLEEASQWLPVGESYEEFKGVMRLSMLKYTPEGMYAFERDADTPITLTIDGDNISLENTAEGQEVLGTIWDGFTGEAEEYNGKWNVGADFSTVLSVFNEVPVTVPDGAVAENYMMKYTEAYDNQPSYAFVKFYSVGDDVYIQGFYNGDESYTIKGTRQGNKVHFDAPQFVGVSYGYIMEVTSCTYTKDTENWIFDYVDKGAFDLTYDEETQTYSLPQGEAMRLTVRNMYESNWATYCDLCVYPYEPKLLTPKEPYIVDVADYYDLEGDWCVAFSYEDSSEEGEPLDMDCLSYCFYINGELYTFDADRYDLNEDLTEIPFSLSGNQYLNVPNYWCVYNYIREKDINKVGLQLIYRVNGEEARSTINEWVSEGIKDVNAMADSNAPRYDLNGRRVSESYHGIVVCNGKKIMQ